MKRLFGFLFVTLIVPSIVWIARKGYGYKEVIDRLNVGFKDISQIKLSFQKLSFLLRLNFDNPTWQSINIDAVFLDLYVVEGEDKSILAQIRKEDLNQTIDARKQSTIGLPIKVSLLSAGDIIFDNISSFFSNKNVINKSIYILGDVVAEGVRIPVEDTFNASIPGI